MAKQPKPPRKLVQGLPTRQQVLDFIASSPTPAGKREIGKAFGLKGQEKIQLKALLRDMADEGLIDGIRGTLNFASGEWQGYQPQDFVATIDLQRETEIKSLGGGFLQNARSWIWMPTHIEFEVSADNVNFKKVADIKTADVDPTDMSPVIRDYTADIAPVRARYVRIKAYNLGKIPSWHPGSGGDAFVFVD